MIGPESSHVEPVWLGALDFSRLATRWAIRCHRVRVFIQKLQCMHREGAEESVRPLLFSLSVDGTVGWVDCSILPAERSLIAASASYRMHHGEAEMTVIR